MAADPNDLVRVAAGPLTQVQLWHDVLRAAGIESRVVGGDLTAGLGSALPGSVELWVHRADAGAAETAIAGAGGYRRRLPESRPVPPHGHPESGSKPDHSRGGRPGRSPRDGSELLRGKPGH